MPRRRIIRTSRFPYHITARSNNQEWFKVTPGEFWRIFLSQCLIISQEYGVEFHALVVMSNHLHMILSTPDNNLDAAMNYLFREITKAVNHSTNRINHLFGRPYTWSMITSMFYYCHAFKYVYRNPVEAKICDRVEDYPFSSLQTVIGKQELPFALNHWKWSGDWIKWGRTEGLLRWLNTEYPAGLYESLESGFKNPEFVLPISESTARTDAFFEKEITKLDF